MRHMATDRTIRLLRAGGVALLVDVTGPLLPRVLHWGADPGDLDGACLAAAAWALDTGSRPSAPDEPPSLTLLPGEAEGWSGGPGLAGHRDGAAAFPRLRLTGPVTTGPARGREGDDGATGTVLRAMAADPLAGIATSSELLLEPCGVVRLRHTVTNTAPGTYTVDALTALLPVPSTAREVLDLTGRWCRERSPQRAPFHHGTHARQSRRGRTGHDATLLLMVGTPGFGWRHGEVWGAHVAWSGNHHHVAERLPDPAAGAAGGVLGGGELLLPGEVRLAPGESYTTPWVFFTWSGDGLDGASSRIHRWLRSRPCHPRRPRPLVLNTWEAVYFDHDLDTLTRLAERAADIGVERFVLDDGWFSTRRDDTRGLGDWYASPAVWPQGLRPLAERVRGLGMEFGLWVEPEMVNPDSDLARAHPDWLLAPSPRPGRGVDPGRLPRSWRHQAVLDIANPQVSAYLLECLHAVITEAGVAYLKWDHNRDLFESLHTGQDGVARPGVHGQTLAVYRLLDELRERHPGLEIESCSSGGARVDLEILRHTDRVWASDCNDALERQAIQRWTGLLLPCELVGTHVGPPTAHTTHRTLSLGLRTLTALFGHAGLEWDITACTGAELEALRAWSALYRELRPLLHGGEAVRVDDPDPGAVLHGVVAHDRSEAVFAYVRLETSPDAVPGRLRLPGLDARRCYLVTRRDEAGVPPAGPLTQPPWLRDGSVRASGAVLETIGLAAPLLDPAQGVLLHLRSC
jgi:alpha-galactosidase